ncbi:DUF2911 domain-containing protein [Dyadobacter sp. LHD-138]|uniref:DUF2911 domain-containing protein n=1 Tax=Dyadobacter sp. LHD-138 TaxID=3071413 RepID=UPI0027E1CF5D|nr:DUF2911 domain-containing protein [Dyadobacter sp. LHD-138]MDQ6481501.1 DUF2911 domain-containing protein [Dyadobacter sp. LHD-138]
MRKAILLSSMLCIAGLSAHAQTFRGLDKSPMDMAYYPDNFAHDRKGDEKALIKVTYSRPAKNNREVMGKLVPFGKVWRMGADESPEIKFYQDATFGGKKVKAGSYSLFAIAGATEWTVILNKDVDFWGAYKYKEENDVLRVKVPAKKTDTTLENFSLQFAKDGNGAVMNFGWENTVVSVPITF